MVGKCKFRANQKNSTYSVETFGNITLKQLSKLIYSDFN